MNLENYVRVIKDFPKAGISFKDITPILYNPDAFKYCIDQLANIAKKYKPTLICAPEARGFVFGSALALKMGIGIVLARKPGKLPGELIGEEYNLEYGTNTIYVCKDLLKPGERVLLVDDLIATGGSLKALKNLVIKCGATPIAAIAPIKLIELNGDKNIGLPTETLLELSDSH